MLGVVALDFINFDLDETKTFEAVKDFFKEDFQKYLNYSGKHRTDLSSPILDPTGVTAHGVNHQENRMVINADAARCVEAVNDTIIDCTNTPEHPYATILFLSFIRHFTDEKASIRVSLSSTTYGRFKKSACIEFAQRIDYWKQVHGADIRELTVFVKKEDA